MDIHTCSMYQQMLDEDKYKDAQKSQGWIAERAKRVTASVIGSVVYMTEGLFNAYKVANPNAPVIFNPNKKMSGHGKSNQAFWAAQTNCFHCEPLTDADVEEAKKKGSDNSATDHGNNFEDLARLTFERIVQKKTDTMQLRVHDRFPDFLGASPDSIVDTDPHAQNPDDLQHIADHIATIPTFIHIKNPFQPELEHQVDVFTRKTNKHKLKLDFRTWLAEPSIRTPYITIPKLSLTDLPQAGEMTKCGKFKIAYGFRSHFNGQEMKQASQTIKSLRQMCKKRTDASKQLSVLCSGAADVNPLENMPRFKTLVITLLDTNNCELFLAAYTLLLCSFFYVKIAREAEEYKCMLNRKCGNYQLLEYYMQMQLQMSVLGCASGQFFECEFVYISKQKFLSLQSVAEREENNAEFFRLGILLRDRDGTASFYPPEIKTYQEMLQWAEDRLSQNPRLATFYFHLKEYSLMRVEYYPEFELEVLPQVLPLVEKLHFLQSPAGKEEVLAIRQNAPAARKKIIKHLPILLL